MYFLKLAAVVFPALLGWASLGFAYAGPKAPPEFDVTSFDAIPGDGIDDTAAITKCLTAAAAETPCVVFFPRGVYDVRLVNVGFSDVTIDGYGATLRSLGGGGFNANLYLGANRIRVRGLEIDGNYPAVTPSGDGYGVLIGAFDDITVEDLYVHNTLHNGIVTQQGGEHHTIRNCRIVEAGYSGLNLSGDCQIVERVEIIDWNARNLTPPQSPRAILIDPQDCDSESIELRDIIITQTRDDLTYCDEILIDCGDGDFTTGDWIEFGSNGAPTEDGDNADGGSDGYARFTLDMGHGFLPQDGIWLANDTGGSGRYNGFAHQVLKITGNVFVNVVDANTIKLYDTAINARAGGATGLIDLTSEGAGTFYVNSAGARSKRILVTCSTDVDTTDDEITCTGHNFRTGFMARLQVINESTGQLPGGLHNAATVTFKTPYAAGVDVTYRQPHRIRNVTIDNVQVTHGATNGVSTDSNSIKCNSVENLYINRYIQNQGPDVSGNEHKAIRLGQNNRNVTITNSRMAGPLMINTATWVPNLKIDRSEIGGVEYAPEVALERISCGNLTVTNSTLRFHDNAISGPNLAGEMQDRMIGLWEIHDNTFEGYSSSRVQIFSFRSDDFLNSRMIRFYGNRRRNVHPDYTGLSVSSVDGSTNVFTMSTHSQIKTGDQVQVRLNAGSLNGVTDGSWYYARKRGNTTLSLHTTEAAAFADTSLVDIDTLSAGVTLWSPEIGVQYSGNGFRDIGLFQRPGDESEFVDVAAPSSNVFAFNVGDIVWNMHPTSTSQGWICTVPGVAGSSAATFVEFDAIP